MPKRLRVALFVMCAALLFPLAAHANSSWHWFTDSPLIALPWAIIGVLLAEVCLICSVGHLKVSAKSVAVICLANTISFLLPYVFIGLIPDLGDETMGFLGSIQYYVHKLPYYIVGTGFLLLTLLSEIPIVYFTLRRDVSNGKKFLVTIVLTNILTTAVLAVVERLLFQGSW